MRSKLAFSMPLLALGFGLLGPTICAAKTDVDATGIGSNLQCMIDAHVAARSRSPSRSRSRIELRENPEFKRCASNGMAEFDGDLVELQLHIQSGINPTAIPARTFEQLGGRAGVRGINTMIAWLPLTAIKPLLTQERRVVFVQLPQRPVHWTGKVDGQGGKILRDSKVQCTGITGSGITVAVVDSGFSNLDKAKESKDVPKIVGDVKFTGGNHGTMCAEVVAEVAPAARIRPAATPSLPFLQAFVNELVLENKHSVDIVSHSVGWLGMSFGRHTGPLCELTDLARGAGIAWVNASGNNGGGNFYTAKYVDKDFDGNHDVLPGEPKLLFRLGNNADVQIYFDWDDYEAKKVDLDIELFREEKGFFKLFAKSVKSHGFYTGTSEIIAVKGAPGGVYALVMRRDKAGANPDGVRLRILNKSTKSTPLSVHHKHNNVYDPANCKGVLAVGALRHNLYEKGPLETYSSYGPTIDGRQKPEIVAPTGVSTTVGAFFGTSAACPHAAGALALYAAATKTKAIDLMDQLIEDATPMGNELPDVAYGFGRLTVNAARLGWDCDEDTIDLPAPCTTTCGTVGKRWCNEQCGWNKCVPPWETCNGVDDDCDGLTDEEEACQPRVPDDDAGTSALDALEVKGEDVAAEVKPEPLPDDGCSAGTSPTPMRSVPWLLLLAVAVLVARRRSLATLRNRG